MYRTLNDRFFRQSFESMADWLMQDLERAGVVRRDGIHIVAADAS
jgi:hypothetical protein